MTEDPVERVSINVKLKVYPLMRRLSYFERRKIFNTSKLVVRDGFASLFFITNVMFKYFNPNPKYDGKNQGYKQIDCTVRSICAGTGLSWKVAYLLLSDQGLKEFTMPHDMVVYRKTIESLGFSLVKKCKKGKLTVRDIANLSKKTKAIYLCKCMRHVVCCRDGNVLDVFDCSEREVLEYWVKS